MWLKAAVLTLCWIACRRRQNGPHCNENEQLSEYRHLRTRWHKKWTIDHCWSKRFHIFHRVVIWTRCSGIFVHGFITNLLLILDGTEMVQWYGDGAGNTVEKNSSVFSLIHTC